MASAKKTGRGNCNTPFQKRKKIGHKSPKFGSLKGGGGPVAGSTPEEKEGDHRQDREKVKKLSLSPRMRWPTLSGQGGEVLFNLKKTNTGHAQPAGEKKAIVSQVHKEQGKSR